MDVSLGRKSYPTRADFLDAFEDVGHTVRWRKSRKGVRAGHEVTARDGRGYVVVTLNGRQVGVHRVLWVMRNHDIPDGFWIDHRDGNQLNNAPENLRLATPAENNRNRRMNRNNTSGAKCVTWNKNVGKWQVQMCVGGGKSYYAGLFANFDEAVAAAKAAREVLHADFHNHAEQP